MTLQVIRARGENIDKMLKRFKGRVSSTKLIKKIRERMYYEKPSIVDKKVRSKGAYKQGLITKSN